MSIETKIDELAALSQQVKALEAQIKSLKDDIINTCGEGKFRGVTYGVTVSLFNSTVVEYKKLIEEMQIPQEVVSKFSRQNAVIRVVSTH